VKERFKKIESYHIDVPNEQKYIHPKAEDHGTDGPLHLSYADPWERGLTDVFQAAEEVGLGGTVYSHTKLLFFLNGSRERESCLGSRHNLLVFLSQEPRRSKLQAPSRFSRICNANLLCSQS
jgi:hypothetical protein